MKHHRRLLVGLTLGAHDAPLVRYAALAARLLRPETVVFAHVRPPADDEAASTEPERARAALQERVADGFDAPAGTDVQVELRTGVLLDALLALSRDRGADLILVGKHRGGGLLAERLMRKAPGSVLVVPLQAPPVLERVLVPVDFSNHAVDAAETAGALARAAGTARLDLLHVYGVPDEVAHGEGDASFAAALRERAERAADLFTRRLDLRGLEARTHLVGASDVPEAIAHHLRRQAADLLVVGTRGRSPGATILLGNVAEQLVRRTDVPLLAVRRPGTARRLLDALLEEHRIAQEMPGPDAALEALLHGNARFAGHELIHPHQDSLTQAQLTGGQHPFAVVLACVDSRVPPELVFDRGLGDLLVIRTAGNVVDEVVQGSIEYGVAVLGSPLLVVLGHERCGAVGAALEALAGDGTVPGAMQAFVDRIAPAVEAAGDEEPRIDRAVRKNVEVQMQALRRSPIICEALADGRLRMVGAVYDLESGAVHVLDGAEAAS